ncbi:MAG: hypothetical protein QM736_24025 [Vicinamibacterales bacterium]
MNSNDVAKWNETQWRAQVKYVRPSGGGAVGVLFVWTTAAANPLFDHVTAGYGNPDTCDFIIKPVKGSAASTKVAEKVLTSIGGTGSPNSKPIERASRLGSVILEIVARCKMLTDQGKDYNGLPPTPNDQPAIHRVKKLQKRWAEVIDRYRTADYFLIQDYVREKVEMGDEIRTQSGLRTIIRDERLMVNLGRLFVADAVLGNGDRLCQVNTGNVMFTKDGRMWAIDSATVLTKYNDVCNDFTTQSWGGDFSAPSPQQWGAQNHHARLGVDAAPLGEAGVHAGTSAAGDPRLRHSTAVRARRLVPGHVQGSPDEVARLRNAGAAEEPPDDSAADPAQTERVGSGARLVQAGIEEGLVAVDQKLSGLNWLLLKQKYQGYVKRYGGDSNVDWMNFKIRRMYIKARRKGKSQDEALAVVQDYVKGKFPNNSSV